MSIKPIKTPESFKTSGIAQLANADCEYNHRSNAVHIKFSGLPEGATHEQYQDLAAAQNWIMERSPTAVYKNNDTQYTYLIRRADFEQKMGGQVFGQEAVAAI